jgi:hypothetical protein
MSISRIEDQFPLAQLPAKIRRLIYSHLLPSKLGLFAQTSKQYEAETVFSRLLAACIHTAPASLDDHFRYL